MCSSGCPGIHSACQAGLELRNIPASALPNTGIAGECHHGLVLLVQSMDLLVTLVSWLLLILSKISGPVALF